MSIQRISHLGQSEFTSRLQNQGIGIELGPLNANLTVRVSDLYPVLFELYKDYPIVPTDGLYSFHAELIERRSTWKPWNRLVRFKVDGRTPHEDMLSTQALPVLEWGINLVIALRSHSFLMLHSAVLEKNGYSLILPAAPGAGKSTLCAVLAYRGWRLLSDEFGLVRPDASNFESIPRPIALKNESIDVFKSVQESAYVGPTIPDTRKGDVAHVAPPTDSVLRQFEHAPAKWVVFPRWQAGAPLTVQRVPEAEAFMMLAMNAFNYELLGEAGFRAVSRLITECECLQLVYSDLDEAVQFLDEFVTTDE